MIDVVMPQMGESIVEGTLTKWLKKIGDRVERDEPLFEISTDKVDTEIPAPSAGTLAATLVEEGKTVAINTVVARIDEAGGAVASTPQKATAGPAPQPPHTEKPAATPAAASPVPEPRIQAVAELAAEPTEGRLSPLVRRMVRENNIDVRRVRGTGADGRDRKSVV